MQTKKLNLVANETRYQILFFYPFGMGQLVFLRKHDAFLKMP
jgi:hypothetical protein